MYFLKTDLCGYDYHWEDTSQTVFSGAPSRRLFDRFNGAQVLYLINYYASLNEGFNQNLGRKMEELILYKLPADIKSEISVYNWLKSILDQVLVQGPNKKI